MLEYGTAMMIFRQKGKAALFKGIKTEKDGG